MLKEEFLKLTGLEDISDAEYRGIEQVAHEPRRTDTVHDTPGRRRPAASLPARDKEPVRETGKQMKPVPCAATEQQLQPKKKPRYVELSLFPDL